MSKLLVLVAALALAAASTALAQAPTVPPGLAGPHTVGKPKTLKPDQWIVVLDAEPLARYDGGVGGLRATAPEATGRALDRDSAAARAYVRYLDDRQAAVLRAAAPNVKPDVEYRSALAGFAAKLSDDQVKALRGEPGVRRVVRETFLQPTQESPGAASVGGSEPELLGLPDGLWQRLGGPGEAGKGVIVGVVDTGITPQHPSFADGGLEFPDSWDGACQGGQAFPTTSCNDKLIGARYFLEGIGRDNLLPGMFASPRDDVGHGTHVAGIAAGNVVDPLVGGDDLGVDQISGVAPAAHVAAYKVCWPLYGCSDVDIVAAIDTAVADGVDVINLSLGRPLFIPGEKLEPVQLAALSADAAGVAVAAAAGNSGEQTGIVGSISSPATAPWTIAVGATTGQRTFRSTVRASGPDGAVVEARASMLGPGLPEAELVDAAKVGRPIGDFVEARNCLDLAAEQVRGKVVLCDYPGNFLLLLEPGRIAKTVKDADGVGVLLTWPFAADPPQWTWPLPTAVITRAEGAEVRRLLDAGETTVSSTPGHAFAREPDRMAPFSSRGPVAFMDETFRSTDTELLRPDVSAPGVDALAAFAPRTFFGHEGQEWSEEFASLSGTSMAAPTVAGAAALLTQVHPQWSPAAIRSALVTTAKTGVIDTDGTPAGAEDAGGGRIDPTAAADADLVVEPSADEYRRYAEGLDPEAIEGDLEPIAARDLNVPSLALPKVTDPVEISRTFTNAGSRRATWTIDQFTSPDGNAIVLSDPPRFTLGPGQRRTVRFLVAIRQGTADYRNLAITLRNDATERVTRLPIAARNPGLVEQPNRVSASGAAGERDVEVTVSGPVTATAYGLARPEVTRDLATEGEFEPMAWVPLKLSEPADAVLAQATPKTPGAQLGVGLYRDGDGNGRISQEDEFLRGIDAGTPDNESFNLDLPAGDYLVGVFSGAPEAFDLRTWTVRDPKPDDPDPAPGLVTEGDPLSSAPAWTAKRTLKLRWNGADGAEPLRGIVLWNAGAEPSADERLGATLVEVAPGT